MNSDLVVGPFPSKPLGDSLRGPRLHPPPRGHAGDRGHQEGRGSDPRGLSHVPGPFLRREGPPNPGGPKSCWKPTGRLSSTPRPPADLHLIRLFYKWSMRDRWWGGVSRQNFPTRSLFGRTPATRGVKKRPGPGPPPPPSLRPPTPSLCLSVSPLRPSAEAPPDAIRLPANVSAMPRVPPSRPLLPFAVFAPDCWTQYKRSNIFYFLYFLKQNGLPTGL